MSFDLFAWYPLKSVGAKKALAIYHASCEGDNVALPSRPETFSRFNRALLHRYPPLEDLTESQLDLSPWAVSPYVTDREVQLSLVWSSVETAVPVIKALFLRYELLCFDPQANEVQRPHSLLRGRKRD